MVPAGSPLSAVDRMACATLLLGEFLPLRLIVWPNLRTRRVSQRCKKKCRGPCSGSDHCLPPILVTELALRRLKICEPRSPHHVVRLGKVGRLGFSLQPAL